MKKQRIKMIALLLNSMTHIAYKLFIVFTGGIGPFLPLILALTWVALIKKHWAKMVFWAFSIVLVCGIPLGIGIIVMQQIANSSTNQTKFAMASIIWGLMQLGALLVVNKHYYD